MDNEVHHRVDDAYRRTTWGNTTAGAEDWKQILEGDDEQRRQMLFPQEEICACLSRLDTPMGHDGNR